MKYWLAVLAACGGNVPAPREPVRNEGAGYPWFDRTSMVAIDNGKLVAYALGPGATELARLEIPQEGPFVVGEWLDREHLFVRVDHRRVYHLSRHGLVEVALPPPAQFAAPRPEVRNANDLTEGGPGGIGEEGGLVVGKDEVFWAECPWGFIADRFHCEGSAGAGPKSNGWRVARIWPQVSGVTARALPARVEHGFAFPNAAPPSATLEGENGVLACAVAGKSATIDAESVRELIEPEPPPDDAEDVVAEEPPLRLSSESVVLDAHWLRADNPLLLVRWASPGFDSLVEHGWSMHAGCGLQPVETGSYAQAGAAPFWIDSTKGRHVRAGAERILSLPSDASVFFRPTGS